MISEEHFSLRTIEKVGPNLGYLYLSGLRLKQLPAYIFSLIPNLKWLDVRDNRIMDIPLEIASHHRLQVRTRRIVPSCVGICFNKELFDPQNNKNIGLNVQYFKFQI